MSLFKLKLPGGIYRNGTEYQSMGRWFFAQLVRFIETANLAPLGGWRIAQWSQEGIYCDPDYFSQDYSNPVLPVENLMDESEDFSGYTQISSPTLTTGQDDPFGGTSATDIDDPGSGTMDAVYDIATFKEDGVKCVSVFIKEGTGTSRPAIGIYDETDAVWMHKVGVSAGWTGGVPVAVTLAGSGEVFNMGQVASGWFRMGLNVELDVSHVHRIYLYGSGYSVPHIGSSVFFGLQAENQAAPSEYVASTGGPTTGTGAAKLIGAVRGLLAWRANDATPNAIVATNEKLYAFRGNDYYDITPADLSVGLSAAVAGGSPYGAGLYGDGLYSGSTDVNPAVQEGSAWSLDTFGEYMVGVLAPSDGRLLNWQLGLSTAAAVVSGAPTSLRGVVVTEERHLVALGAGGNPRRVEFAAQETLTTWTATPTNTAGGFELATPGRLVCGRRLRGETLLWTDVDVHAMIYRGPPLVYGWQRRGSGGIVGPNAVAVLDNGAVWMGPNGFFIYDGFVQGLESEVGDYVFSDFNESQAYIVGCTHISGLSEVMWFYPSAGSEENDRYVLWNYKDNTWSIGELARAGGWDKGVFPEVMMCSPDGHLYEHEIGWDYGTRIPRAESGPIEIGQGDRLMNVHRIVPDDRNLGDVSMTFKTKYYPDGEESTHGPFTLTELTDTRFQARQIRQVIEGVNAVDWRVGVTRIDVTPGGSR